MLEFTDANIKINNVSDYAWDYKYIVARKCDGEYWFWGAYNEFDRALYAAEEEGGQIFPIDKVAR